MKIILKSNVVSGGTGGNIIFRETNQPVLELHQKTTESWRINIIIQELYIKLIW